MSTKSKVKVIPIKWVSQHEGLARRNRRDGWFGSVNGDELLFIYRTSDPYCKGWKSWDKKADTKPPEGATFRYRRHWNVWLYFAGGQGNQVARALKSDRQAKRTARRILVQKLNALLR